MALRTPVVASSSLCNIFSYRSQSCNSRCHYGRRNTMEFSQTVGAFQQTKHYETSSSNLRPQSAPELKGNSMSKLALEMGVQKITGPPTYKSCPNSPSEQQHKRKPPLAPIGQFAQDSIKKYLNESELDHTVETLSTGAGYVILPSIHSPKDTEAAYSVIQEEMKSNKNEVETTYSDIKQNTYSGLLYGLLSHGDIFLKFVTNEIILQISNRILGECSRLSSLSSNTISKGMIRQNPHTDYPYHRKLWPRKKGKNFALNNLMSLTFISALCDLTPENGSIALVPGSQMNFEYPDDVAEFERKAIQISAKRGDLCVIAGSIQHCSMSNKTEMPRCVILQQMVPLYVNPFENFSDFEKYVPMDDKVWKQLLAKDHPLPKNQFHRSTNYQL